MTIEPEDLSAMLMAYADGELDPISAKRVERAIANDPSLADEVAQQRQLRAMLEASFAPVAAAPVPDAIRQLVPATPVIDLASVRADRTASARPRGWRAWGTGGAIAASLVLGLMIGQRMGEGPVVTRGGALIAAGQLARTLDTQLASAQPGDAPLRILVSFRNQSGDVCRSFSGAAISGIACRDDQHWVLRETRGGLPDAQTEFRQAGSTDAALMADAQSMMAGDPLDAAAEAAAKAKGWQREKAAPAVPR